MPAEKFRQVRDLALAFGCIAALLWGIGLSLIAFYSPGSMEWAEWCALLAGGVATAVGLPLAGVWTASWVNGRQPVRRRHRAA